MRPLDHGRGTSLRYSAAILSYVKSRAHEEQLGEASLAFVVCSQLALVDLLLGWRNYRGLMQVIGPADSAVYQTQIR